MSLFLNSRDEVVKRLYKVLNKKVCILRAFRANRLVKLLNAHNQIGSK